MSTFIDFAEIKQQVSIEQVASWLELTFEDTGKQLRGCCPIHKGSDKRDFVITPTKGLFYCFKCQEGGDQIKLYALLKGCDQKSAANEIARRLGASDSVQAEGDRGAPSPP